MNPLKFLRKPYLATLLSTLLLFVSCNQKKEIILDDSSQVIQKKLVDDKLINDFKNLNLSKFSSKSTNNLEFDYTNVYEVSINGNSETMLMANQTNFDEKNSENYAISAAITEGGLSNPMIVKTSKVSDELYKIEYFNSNLKLLSTIELNPKNQTINTSNNFQNKINFALKSSDDCGQKTADCLADAYTNHGWVSVWAFVQTAFIPATGVALAAACAVKNCVE